MIIDHLSLVSLSKSSPFEFYSFLIDSKKLSRETNAFLSFSVRQGKLFYTYRYQRCYLRAASLKTSSLESLDHMKSFMKSLS